MLILLLALFGVAGCPGSQAGSQPPKNRFERELDVKSEATGRTSFALPESAAELWQVELADVETVPELLPGQFNGVGLMPDGNLAVLPLKTYGLGKGESFGSFCLYMDSIQVYGEGGLIAEYPLAAPEVTDGTIQMAWSAYVAAPEPYIVTSSCRLDHNLTGFFNMLGSWLSDDEEEDDDGAEDTSFFDLMDSLEETEINVNSSLSARSLTGVELWTVDTGTQPLMIEGPVVVPVDGKLFGAAVDLSPLLELAVEEMPDPSFELAAIDAAGQIEKLGELPTHKTYWDFGDEMDVNYARSASGDTYIYAYNVLSRLSRQGKLLKSIDLDLVLSQGFGVSQEGSVYLLAQYPPSKEEYREQEAQESPWTAKREHMEQQDTYLKIYDPDLNEIESILFPESGYQLLGVDLAGNALLQRRFKRGTVPDSFDLGELGNIGFDRPVYGYEFILNSAGYIERWRLKLEDYKLGLMTEPDPAICAGNGYLVQDNDTLFFITLDGKQGWTYECKAEITQVVPGDDRVLYVSLPGKVIAIGDQAGGDVADAQRE